MKKDFISPLSDFGFNNLFGTEHGKENLIDLLNAILHERLGFEKVVDLKLNPTENKGIAPERKTTRYDIHCITDKGHRIIVEMQNNWHSNFNNRLFYYGIEAISRQDRRTEGALAWDFTIDPVVTIAICNFRQKKFGERPVIYHTFRDEETNERFGNQLSLVFLQLPHFTDNEEECDTFLKKIIYSLKNMERIQTMEKIPFSTEDGDFFSRIVKRSRYSALSEEEQLAYDRWLKFENDRLLDLEYSRREGLEKGIAEGREKGRAEGIAEGRAERQWESAMAMAQDGVPIEKISKYTGIPVSELQNKLTNLK
ncbi:MAG: Rpn family recombination-promoting nuclease/putative transposase [Muribaculaceae bacterium]|nr:Rpn family recombination-promoting nuclease/putative transposase [Muribaculaceae bacterium]